MKKIILSIFTIGFALTMQAQSLSLLIEGAPIADNDTLEVFGEIPHPDGIYYEIVAHARVKNNTDRSVNVLVERITIDTVTGSMNQFCWVQCFAPWVSVSPTPYTIGAYDTTAEDVFSGHYLPQEQLGTSLLKYVFYLESDPDDKISMVVKYIIEPNSLDDNQHVVQFGNAYPNPARDFASFDYVLPSSNSDATLKIYNLLGQPIMEKQLSGSNGTLKLSVADLKDGIYLYALQVNDQIVLTRKLFVKK